MSLKISLLLLITLIMPISIMAQGISYNHVQQAQQNIQNSIKGTLDGFVNAPQYMNNPSQLVFPRNFHHNSTVNPWSQNKEKQQSMPSQSYNAVPKGNPWAPIGAPNLPFNSRNMMPPEKNPYTDAPVQRQVMPYTNFSSMPFGGFQNQFSPLNNGSFASPFSDNLFPSNQFWPGGNTGNGSFPFMPW